MQLIRQATVNDCELIHNLAAEVFPCTYQNILSEKQIVIDGKKQCG